MKFKSKVKATLKALPTILTFRHYYLCDECHHLHKFTGHEFPAYGGWWERYIFVNEECAMELQWEVMKMLFKEAEGEQE